MTENNNYIWAKQIGGAGTQKAYSITLDSFGNVYTAGEFKGTVDFNPGTSVDNMTSFGDSDAFISKLDSNGNFIWAKQLGGTNTDAANEIVVDSSGNVYTVGLFFDTADFDPGAAVTNLTSAGSADVFISKLDANGQYGWAVNLGGSNSDKGYRIAIDTEGNVYTTGDFTGTADFDTDSLQSFNLTSSNDINNNPTQDIFISKLRPDATFVWAKQLGGSGFDVVNSIAIDSLSGGVYTTGYFDRTADFDPGTGVSNTISNAQDVFISKLNSDGSFVWVKQLGGSNNDFGDGITTDSSGNVYAVGTFSGTDADLDSTGTLPTFSSKGNLDVFVSKLDPTGNFIWTKQLGGTGLDAARSIGLDSLGNVYTTGRFDSTDADFDPNETTVQTLSTIGQLDVFISKLDTNGNFVWAQQLGGANSEEGQEIGIDSLSGSVYTTGYFNSTDADFDPGTGQALLSSQGFEDVFISKLGLPPIYDFSSTTYTIPEGNTTTTFSFVQILRTGDTSVAEDITITATGGSANPGIDYTSGPYIVSFLAGQTSAFIPLDVFGDLVDEFDENITLEITGFSGNGTTGTLVSTILNITDDDTSGVSIIQTGNSTNIAEGGITDNYTIALTSVPTAPVTITLTPSNPEIDLGQGAGIPLNINFAADTTALNPQTVTVIASNDSIFEGNHSSIITHTVASADPNYNDPNVPFTVDGIVGNTVTANITDNDIADITLTTTDTLTSEAGDTANFNLVLTSQPTSDVLISLSNNNPQEGSLSTPSVTFNSTNWSIPQLVTITGVDDNIQDGDISYSIISSVDPSSDRQYINLLPDTLNLINQDNDSIGINLTTSDTLTSEAGDTANFNLVLTSQPTSDVLISLTNNDTTEGSLSTPSIIFNSTNWSIPQLVTITGVDDNIQDGDISYSIISRVEPSSDSKYINLPNKNISITNVDNDTANILINPNILKIIEGNNNNYSIVLTTEPIEPITIIFNTDANLKPISDLIFDKSNWNIPQTVLVEVVDNQELEGDRSTTITHQITSSEPSYKGLIISSVSVEIQDNDVLANISINPTNLSLTEGEKNATYQISLSAKPNNPVIINFQTEDPLQPISSLTFDQNNWNQPQTIEVKTVDDAIAESPQTTTISHTLNTTDPQYIGVSIFDITATVNDNDIPSIKITQSQGSTNITEGGNTDFYEVILTSQPTANVTVKITPDSQSDLGNGEDNPIELTFTPDNWNSPQLVTVTAIDDSLVEDEIHTSTLLHSISSNDINYNSTTPILIDQVQTNLLTVNITENDKPLPPGTPGIRLIQPVNSTEVWEGFGLDNYKIVLESEPTADVAITINYNNQVKGDQQTLNFTPNNWNIPQIVWMEAIDDLVKEGAQLSLPINHITNSQDSRYNALEKQLSLNIEDNDNIDEIPNPNLNSVIALSSKDNEILASQSDDIIYGREGNDELMGQGGNDMILGQQDADGLMGEAGNDLLIGGNKTDFIDGGIGDDILFGGEGNDRLWGREGNDQLFGELGNDRLDGGEGTDTLTGFLGNDAFVISDSLGTQILNKVDIVTDFKPTEDKIELPFGLTFEQLKITQGTNEWNQDTFIQLKSNGNSLMILQKIAATTLDSGDFI